MKFFAGLSFVIVSFLAITNSFGQTMLDKTVIVKFENSNLKSVSDIQKIDTQEAGDQFIKSLEIVTVKKKFPRSKNTNKCNGCVDLSSIYELTYNANIPVYKVVKYFESLPNVVYAQPHYLHESVSTSNDTFCF